MDSYRRVFVLPTLAERVIFKEVFAKSSTIQASAMAAVNDFLQQAQAPGADFGKLAAQKNRPVQRLVISTDGSFDWQIPREKRRGAVTTAPSAASAPKDVNEAVAKHLGNYDPGAAKFWSKQFTQMKSGEVFPSPVDQGENFLAVRYVGPDNKKKNAFMTEVVTFPKADYNAWFEAEKAKIK